MNYRHAFHAGNHADVFKHAVLLWCLAYLKAKPAPFAVLDTHAGAGRYDLTSEEARRSPEWEEAAGRVFDWPDPPLMLEPYLDALRAANEESVLQIYPGSPSLIRAALRPQDRMIACELHEEDAPSLKRLFRRDAQAQIHARDGWAALTALLPFAEKRGLVLIDPPYEEEGELDLAARAIAAALPRFPGGTFLWWRPLKDAAAVDAADAGLRAQAPGAQILRADLAIAAPADRLNASSLVIVNPPYGLRAGLPALMQKLALDRGASWRIA